MRLLELHVPCSRVPLLWGVEEGAWGLGVLVNMTSHSANMLNSLQEACDGLLWVVEQIPGLVVSADMTAVLALGYWPSFNVPFFPEVSHDESCMAVWKRVMMRFSKGPVLHCCLLRNRKS